MVNLEKKKSINLSKASEGLSKIKIGLSWDEVNLNGNSPDADSSLFMLGENGKIPSDGFFVFYNNLKSADGSVTHHGDNRSGSGEGDDEVIEVDLKSVSANISQLIIVVTIHNKEDGFHFGNILNSSVRVYNQNNNKVICQYQLTESFDGYDSLVIGRLYRSGNDWEFEAMGQPYEGGLGAAYELYS